MDPFSSFFSTLNVLEISASGLVTVIVVMILTGRLVPKSVSDAWRDAYFKSQEASALKDQALAQFSDAAIVTARALDALPQPGGGESDVEETTETRRRRRQG
jgi:hypothetical protein